jgi:hypothetical protein
VDAGYGCTDFLGSVIIGRNLEEDNILNGTMF